MNKADRNRLDEIKTELGNLQLQVQQLGSDLREMADAEQEKFDNLSEGLQNSERGRSALNSRRHAQRCGRCG